MSATTTNSSVSAASKKSSTVVQSSFAIMFGLFVLGMTGFANIDAVHNAAHDTRHAAAFPCH